MRSFNLAWRSGIVLLFCALSCLAATGTYAAGQTDKASIEDLQRKIAEREREQQELLTELSETEEKELARQTQAIAAEIARPRPRKSYLTPGSKMSAEMQAYFARFNRKIEDCGTRHFPKIEGKSVYGEGIATITLDPDGKAISTEIEVSSGQSLIDEHIAKVVRASSPFGLFPKKERRVTDFFVIVTRFKLVRAKSDDPEVTLDPKDRCVWR
jgi:protein TonB